MLLTGSILNILEGETISSTLSPDGRFVVLRETTLSCSVLTSAGTLAENLASLNNTPNKAFNQLGIK